MTDKRAIDGTKLQYHPIEVAKVLQADSWEKAKECYPIYAEFSPLDYCNHACSFCGVDTLIQHSKKVSLELFETRIAEMAACGLKSLMLAGEGEPLLHKDADKMIVAAKNVGVDVSITTNGVPMTKRFVDEALEHCSWVKVSFNAGKPETYAKIHRCKERDYQTVLDNISYAVKVKRERGLKVDIGLQMVLLPENENEIFRLARTAKRLGCDYFVVKPYSQQNFSETRTYENIEYRDYSLEIDLLEAMSDENFHVTFRTDTIERLNESASYDTCMSTPNLWAYWNSNDDLYSCSAFLTDDRFNLGNLKTQAFQEIWHGEKRRQNYEMMKNFDLTQCRQNCRMSSCNQYLDAIKHSKIPNVSFI